MAETPSQFPGLGGFHPETIQPWIVAVVASVTVLALVSVVVRLLSRHVNRQQLWWDDYTIVFSMMWNLAVVGFIFVMHSNGMGLHVDRIPMDSIVTMAKWLVVAEIFYAWNLVWTKISLLLMYSRLFPTRLIRRTCIGIGLFVVCWGFTIMFLFIFICVPVEKLWYPEIPGRCINQVATWIANAVSTILTDLAILLIPISQIWKLQLCRADKIGLTVSFGLGFFVVFASSYRTSVLLTYDPNNPTYTLAPTVGWTAIEMSAGIASACLPTMRPAIKHLARKCGIKRDIFGGAGGEKADQYQTHNVASATMPPLTAGGNMVHPTQQSQTRKLRSTTVSSGEELVDGKMGVVSSKHGRIDSTSSRSERRGHGHYDNRATSASLTSLPDADLRPDVRHVMYEVSTYPTNSGTSESRRKGSDEGNNIPLNGILVHKDITQSSSLASDRTV